MLFRHQVFHCLPHMWIVRTASLWHFEYCNYVGLIRQSLGLCRLNRQCVAMKTVMLVYYWQNTEMRLDIPLVYLTDIVRVQWVYLQLIVWVYATTHLLLKSNTLEQIFKMPPFSFWHCRFKGKLSDSFTSYNYIGNTKVSVSIKNT